MDYAQLEGIQEGMGASLAYLEAIRPDTSADKREEIRKNLLKYCKHDTEAMVRLVHFFQRQ
jgi:signal transduction histidine kinase